MSFKKNTFICNGQNECLLIVDSSFQRIVVCIFHARHCLAADFVEVSTKF